MGRACKALSWPLDNALGSAHPLSSPKQCWVSEGVTLTGTILKGYSQSGGQEPP